MAQYAVDWDAIVLIQGDERLVISQFAGADAEAMQGILVTAEFVALHATADALARALELTRTQLKVTHNIAAKALQSYVESRQRGAKKINGEHR